MTIKIIVQDQVTKMVHIEVATEDYEHATRAASAFFSIFPEMLVGIRHDNGDPPEYLIKGSSSMSVNRVDAQPLSLPEN